METTIHQLDVSLIDEDPAQPRTEFNQESLQELAETIRSRGVKTPISVRPNPLVEGRYIINHGARRFRASLIAEKKTIPACVDTEYTEEDQLIENLQRDNLTPKEISVFLGKLRFKGHRKGEIAKIIGKSPSWVTQHVSLLDLPPLVSKIFADNRCNDVTVVYELAKMERTHPQLVQAWLDDDQQEINRSALKVLQDFLVSHSTEEDMVAKASPPQESTRAPSPTERPKKKKVPVLHVEIDGRSAILLWDKLPTAVGLGWFSEANGEPFEAALENVRLKKICGE